MFFHFTHLQLGTNQRNGVLFHPGPWENRAQSSEYTVLLAAGVQRDLQVFTLTDTHRYLPTTDATPQLMLKEDVTQHRQESREPVWQSLQACDGRRRGGGSQRPHLDGVNVRGVPGFGGHVQLTKVVAGDDEDDGGGAECHLLLGSGAFAARPGNDDGPDGTLHRSERPLFEAVLQPREAGAEQLQQTAPELWGKHNGRTILAQIALIATKYMVLNSKHPLS